MLFPDKNSSTSWRWFVSSLQFRALLIPPTYETASKLVLPQFSVFCRSLIHHFEESKYFLFNLETNTRERTAILLALLYRKPEIEVRKCEFFEQTFAVNDVTSLATKVAIAISSKRGQLYLLGRLGPVPWRWSLHCCLSNGR